MSQVRKSHLPGVTTTAGKPDAKEIHRRIASACLRLVRRSDEARRKAMINLINLVVAECVDAPKRQSVSDYYRQLQWTAVKEGIGTDMLPSESTFRRRVHRERARRSAIASRKKRARAEEELNVALNSFFSAALKAIPGHTFGLSDDC